MWPWFTVLNITLAFACTKCLYGKQYLSPKCDLCFIWTLFSVKVVAFPSIIHFSIACLSPPYHCLQSLVLLIFPGTSPYSSCQPFDISPVNPQPFLCLTSLTIIYSTLGLCTSKDLLLFCGNVKESVAQQGKKKKTQRTVWGAELPGNNFPPLWELAFIGLQQRNLETLQHKGWFSHTGERQEHKKRVRHKELLKNNVLPQGMTNCDSQVWAYRTAGLCLWLFWGTYSVFNSERPNNFD